LERLADRGDELYNVASNASYYQICGAYVLFILKELFLFIFPFFIKAAYKQTMVGVPIVACAPDFEEP
jgi:hypothetical protein